MTTLRDYQQRTIDQLYAWFEAGSHGNPCLVLPTGSGKSHIVAALCKDALQNWPETRVLMLTHVKELIGQNAEKMRQHWPQGLGRADHLRWHPVCAHQGRCAWLHRSGDH